jgi:hypothetical protein
MGIPRLSKKKNECAQCPSDLSKRTNYECFFACSLIRYNDSTVQTVFTLTPWPWEVNLTTPGKASCLAWQSVKGSHRSSGHHHFKPYCPTQHLAYFKVISLGCLNVQTVCETKQWTILTKHLWGKLSQRLQCEHNSQSFLFKRRWEGHTG